MHDPRERHGNTARPILAGKTEEEALSAIVRGRSKGHSSHKDKDAFCLFS